MCSAADITVRGVLTLTRKRVASAVRCISCANRAQRACFRDARDGSRSRTTFWAGSPAAELMDEAETDALAHLAFRPAHRRRIRSNNLLGRLTKEVKRLSNVIGIFLHDAAAVRLVGATFVEQHGERQVSQCCRAESLAAATQDAPVQEIVPLFATRSFDDSTHKTGE